MPPYQSTFDPREVDAQAAATIARHIVDPIVAALRADGIEPILDHDLDRVAALYHQSVAGDGRMRRLAPLNDPRWHSDAKPADTTVITLQKGGIDVGCIASRIVNCEGVLGEAMESGRFWYGRSRLPAEHSCVVTSELAWGIEDRPILYTASIYLAQELTHSHVLSAMVRLHHVWVTTHRFWSDGIGLAENAITRRHAADVYGVGEISHWVFRATDSEAMERFALLWCSRKRAKAMLTPALGDLSRPIGVPKPIHQQAFL